MYKEDEIMIIGESIKVEEASKDECYECKSPYVESSYSTPSNLNMYLVTCMQCRARFLIDKENKPNIITKL